MEYTPFKCPDCKVWWRTATHLCAPQTPKVDVNIKKESPYTKLPYDKRMYGAHCIICGGSLYTKEAIQSGKCNKHRGEASDKDYF